MKAAWTPTRQDMKGTLLSGPTDWSMRLSGMTVDCSRVHKEPGKQHEQIKNRKCEQAASGAPVGIAATAQLQREQKHRHSGHNRDRAIEFSRKPECPGQHRNRHQEDA